MQQNEAEAASGAIDLRVVLHANGVEVASSRDPAIWLSAMGQITGASPSTGASSQVGATAQTDTTPDSAIEKLARDIGVSRDQLEGAAGPSREPPYIHLDHKYWEALRNSPGTKATAPTVLAATLLLLWDRHAKIGDIDITTCRQVLRTVDLADNHANRALKRCDWIQVRGDAIKLNPAMISKAEELAKRYCARATSAGAR